MGVFKSFTSRFLTSLYHYLFSQIFWQDSPGQNKTKWKKAVRRQFIDMEVWGPNFRPVSFFVSTGAVTDTDTHTSKITKIQSACVSRISIILTKVTRKTELFVNWYFLVPDSFGYFFPKKQNILYIWLERFLEISGLYDLRLDAFRYKYEW